MTHLRSRNFGRRAKTPNRDWAINGSTASVVIPAASKVLLGSFSPSVGSIDETILRTVGQIAIGSDQQAATEFQIGSFGMIVVTDVALAAGAASIPGPFTDGGDHWFVHQMITQRYAFLSAVGVDPREMQLYTFDSSAKRVS